MRGIRRRKRGEKEENRIIEERGKTRKGRLTKAALN